MMKVRPQIIQSLIHINEIIFFYPKLRNFYRRAIKRKDPLILDIGCNKGQTIDFFIELFPDARILAFEPNPTLYDQLLKKYISLPNIELFNLAISEKTGTMLFKEMEIDETSTLEEIEPYSKYYAMKARILGLKPEGMIRKSYPVKTTGLAEFLSLRQMPFIDVLKIDTEGHEYSCLLGLFNQNIVIPKINLIQIEQHHDDQYLNARGEKDLNELLEKNRYFLEKRITHGFGNFDELIFKSKDQ